MISIQTVVEEILYSDEEALFALSHEYMNLSAYAKRIQKACEHKAKKQVQMPSIIMALSRLQKTVQKSHPLVRHIALDSITTKLPLAEISYNKSPSLMRELKSLYEHVSTDTDDFLSMTLSTREITIICSERLVNETLQKFKEEPKKIERGLAGISLSFDEKYYNEPNVTFSLLRKFAVEKISLAETISSYTEVIFVFNEKHLARVVEMFSKDLSTRTKEHRS